MEQKAKRQKSRVRRGQEKRENEKSSESKTRRKGWNGVTNSRIIKGWTVVFVVVVDVDNDPLLVGKTFSSFALFALYFVIRSASCFSSEKTSLNWTLKRSSNKATFFPLLTVSYSESWIAVIKAWTFIQSLNNLLSKKINVKLILYL